MKQQQLDVAPLEKLIERSISMDMGERSARQRGVTLIELMIVLVVAGVLLVLAVPSMSSLFEKQRVIDAAEEFYSQLQLARLTAVARSVPVYFNISADGSTTWSFGVSTNAACDPSDNNPACTLVIDDGAGGDVLVTHRFTSADHPTIQLATTNASIEFDPRRGTAEAAAITLTSTGDRGFRAIAEVALLGQVRLCSPAGDRNVSLYSTASCP